MSDQVKVEAEVEEVVLTVTEEQLNAIKQAVEKPTQKEEVGQEIKTETAQEPIIQKKSMTSMGMDFSKQPITNQTILNTMTNTYNAQKSWGGDMKDEDFAKEMSDLSFFKELGSQKMTHAIASQIEILQQKLEPQIQKKSQNSAMFDNGFTFQIPSILVNNATQVDTTAGQVLLNAVTKIPTADRNVKLVSIRQNREPVKTTKQIGSEESPVSSSYGVSKPTLTKKEYTLDTEAGETIEIDMDDYMDLASTVSGLTQLRSVLQNEIDLKLAVRAEDFIRDKIFTISQTIDGKLVNKKTNGLKINGDNYLDARLQFFTKDNEATPYLLDDSVVDLTTAATMSHDEYTLMLRYLIQNRLSKSNNNFKLYLTAGTVENFAINPNIVNRTSSNSAGQSLFDPIANVLTYSNNNSSINIPFTIVPDVDSTGFSLVHGDLAQSYAYYIHNVNTIGIDGIPFANGSFDLLKERNANGVIVETLYLRTRIKHAIIEKTSLAKIYA